MNIQLLIETENKLEQIKNRCKNRDMKCEICFIQQHNNSQSHEIRISKDDIKKVNIYTNCISFYDIDTCLTFLDGMDLGFHLGLLESERRVFARS